MRAPSGDQTPGEYASFLNVRRVSRPLAKSSVERSPGALYGVSFTTPRMPFGDITTRLVVPGGPNVPRFFPCRSCHASWKLPEAGAVFRYARTPLPDTEKIPVEYHVVATPCATGTASPCSCSRRESNGCAISVPARRKKM